MTDLIDRLGSLTGIDTWGRPEGLVIAACAGIGVLLVGLLHRERGIVWPAFDEARSAGFRRIDGLGIFAALLRAGCVASLLSLFAQPVGVHRVPPPPGDGLDLVLAIDASGSMRALDTQVGSEWKTRLDLARQAVTRFATQRAAAGDRVGLVVFGDSAFTQSPLTSDGALLSAALARVDAGMAGEATALGDALGLAVKRVAGGDSAGAGRVVVLLTDGRHNAGTLTPDEAAQLAASSGVRIHTVAIGTLGEPVAMAAERRDDTTALAFERHDVDTETLERIAAASGGRFHAARRSSDLTAVYAEIDALERVEQRRPPQLRRDPRNEPLLAAAGALLLAEIVLARAFHRRFP